MKIKLIRKIKQRIRDISNVWSVAGIRNVYVMAILPHFGSKSTRDIRRERKQQAILHYLQTNYQNLILKYTQKRRNTPSLQSSTYMGLLVARRKCDATYSTKLLSIFMLTCWQSSGSPYYTRKHIKICYYPGLHPTKGSGRKNLIYSFFRYSPYVSAL